MPSSVSAQSATPTAPQVRLLAENAGFSLRLLEQQFAGEGAADYKLNIASREDGSLAVTVSVFSVALAASELELSYPANYAPQGGRPLPWPGHGDAVDFDVDMATPGRLEYAASLPGDAASEGSSGEFGLVELVFTEVDPASVPVAKITWPAAQNERNWLEKWYMPLPALASPSTVYAEPSWQQHANTIFTLANAARAKKGQPPLQRDPHLDAVAQAHAIHMATDGFFEHKNPQGLDVFERIEAANCPDWWTAGENIAAGQRGPQEAHQSWMDSSGHKVNIRGEKYERIGIGVYYDPDSSMGWYWVQVFASFNGDTAAHGWNEPGSVY